MSSVYTGNLTVSIFGQSHAPAIGVTIDGLPAGFPINLDELQFFLSRRAPGQNAWSTPRREVDAPEVLCGLKNGKTCAKAVKEKADRAELCIRIGECEQELQELLANPAALPDLTGCKINHKVFGAGTVRPAEGQFMVIDFNGTLKKFSYTASMNSGYLSAEDPNVEARLQAYQNYNKDKDRLEKELKNLKAELVKL